MSDEDEDYFVPLQDQRVFGAGIKRKRVPFVPAESEPTSTSQNTPKLGLGERYLSIVLPQSQHSADAMQKLPQPGQRNVSLSGEALCTICKLPMTQDVSASQTKPHESSLVHQVCLSHSHPPSHLDREQVGFRYLSSYGWDPDARRGLGASGTGILAPIRGKFKNDTVGLGVKSSEPSRVQKQVGSQRRLNVKDIRKLEATGKKRELQLRDAFYGKDLEAYLGPGR